MDQLLLTDLSHMMEERYGAELLHTPEYENCKTIYSRHMAQISQQMSRDFHDKLNDILTECAQLENEAAFLWGLRLGLALHML